VVATLVSKSRVKMAAETDFISSANQIEKVRIFLDKCNLSQYFSIFSEQGYDDFDQIVQITKNVEEIESFFEGCWA
jgi:hypothetical protein